MKLLADASLSNGNPTVPLRWCLEPGDVKVLKDAKTQDTYIFIAVVYENGVEDRQLLPLDQTMTYVTFRYPGKHKVMAKLFWLCDEDGKPSAKRTAKLRKCFLEKFSRNVYERTVIDLYGTGEMRDGFSLLWGDFRLSPKASLEVEVQPGYFAKEPPAWLGWWANLWWKYGPADQCELRKRKMLAFTVQPLAMLAWVVLRAVGGLMLLATGLLLGLRKMRIMPTFLPFRERLENTWNELEGANGRHICSVFWHNDTHHDRSWLWIPITPPLILAYLLILKTISSKLKIPFLKLLALIAKWIWGKILLVILSPYFWAAVGVLAAGILAVFLAMYATRSRWMESCKEWRKERKRQAELTETEKGRMLEKMRLGELDNLYKEMQCSVIPWSPSIEALPWKRRTLTLRFHELKSKVCKPFVG